MASLRILSAPVFLRRWHSRPRRRLRSARSGARQFRGSGGAAFPAVVNIRPARRSTGRTSTRCRNSCPALRRGDVLNYEEQQARQVTSLGSGFVIDAGGVIVCNHVIEAPTKSRSTSRTAATPAELGRRREDRLRRCVKADAPLPAVRSAIGRGAIGDWVMAIGNPFGSAGTVTAGIVSRNRDIASGQKDDFIQTDAAINRGNSGPLFDKRTANGRRELAIISPSGGSIGLGFAIPSSIVKRTVDQFRPVQRDPARGSAQHPVGDARNSKVSVSTSRMARWSPR